MLAVGGGIAEEESNRFKKDQQGDEVGDGREVEGGLVLGEDDKFW